MRTASDNLTRERSRGLYVGYDLETPEHEHQGLLRALEALDGRRVDTDLWIVEGDHTPQELFDRLSPYICGGDILAVEHVDPDFGCRGLQCPCSIGQQHVARSSFAGDFCGVLQAVRVH